MFLKRCLEERGLNVGCLVTSGNEIGLTTADYLAYLAQLSTAKAIIVYLENIRDPKRFAAAVEMAADRGIVVIAYKLGRSDAGRRAALAHTGALAGKVEAFDAAFLPRGVVRVDSLDEAVEVAELVTNVGLVKSSRLGGVTTSGAFRGMLLDNAERCGVTFPPLHGTTIERLSNVLGIGSFIGNPIDGGYSIVSNPDNLLECVEALSADDNIDAIVVQGALPPEPGSARAEKYIELCRTFTEQPGAKPVIFASFGSYRLTDYSLSLRRSAGKIAFLQEVSGALLALGKVSQSRTVRAMRQEAVQERLSLGSDGRNEASLSWLSETASRSETRTLNEVASKHLVEAYGIRLPEERVALSRDELRLAVQEVGLPVVMKIISSKIVHKSDVGGVVLNVQSLTQAAKAFDHFESVARAQDAPWEGVLVSEFVTNGVECALGLHHDPEAGHIVMLASGGTMLEIVNDAQFQCLPITRSVAMGMIQSLRSYPLLVGYRGSEIVDIDALCDALVSIGRIAEDCGSLIESIDVNPLRVSRGGCVALDAAVILKQRS
jgi:acetyltransferase